jgi:hypothetical protein
MQPPRCHQKGRPFFSFDAVMPACTTPNVVVLMVAWVPLVEIQFISRGEVTDCNFFLYLGVLYVKSKNYVIIHVFIEILLVLCKLSSEN